MNIADALLYFLLAISSTWLIGIGLKKKMKLATSMGLALPILYSGLRSGVGTDFDRYVLMYHEVIDRNLNDFLSGFAVEPSFYLLAHISHTLFDSPFLFFFVNSLLTVVFFYAGVKRYTDKQAYIVFAYIAFLLIIFPNTMNIVRQGTVMSIAFYAFSFIQTRQFAKYCKWILLSATFHYSALILLPLYFLNRVIPHDRLNDNLARLRILAIFLATAILSPPLLIAITSVLTDRYAEYITAADPGANVMFYLIATILLGLSAIFFLNKDRKADAVMYVYLYSSLAVAMLFAGFFIGETRRIAFYFMPFYGLLIPMVIGMVKDGAIKTGLRFLAYCYPIGYFVLFYVIYGYGDIFPYVTIFTRGYDG